MTVLSKAVLQGALTSGGAVYLFTNSRQSLNLQIQLVGVSIPLWVATFGIGVASSFVEDAVHLWVKSEIPLRNKAKDEASLLVGALSGGLMMNAGLYALNTRAPFEFGMMSAMMLGTSASLLSSYGNDIILDYFGM